MAYIEKIIKAVKNAGDSGKQEPTKQDIDTFGSTIQSDDVPFLDKMRVVPDTIEEAKTAREMFDDFIKGFLARKKRAQQEAAIKQVKELDSTGGWATTGDLVDQRAKLLKRFNLPDYSAGLRKKK